MRHCKQTCTQENKNTYTSSVKFANFAVSNTLVLYTMYMYMYMYLHVPSLLRLLSPTHLLHCGAVFLRPILQVPQTPLVVRTYHQHLHTHTTHIATRHKGGVPLLSTRPTALAALPKRTSASEDHHELSFMYSEPPATAAAPARPNWNRRLAREDAAISITTCSRHATVDHARKLILQFCVLSFN